MGYVTEDVRRLLEEALDAVDRAIAQDTYKGDYLARVAASKGILKTALAHLRHEGWSDDERLERAMLEIRGVFQGWVDTPSDFRIPSVVHDRIYSAYTLIGDHLKRQASASPGGNAGGKRTVLIGAPAQPMSNQRWQVLHDYVRGRKDVLFAYVPQVYIAGKIDPPRQVMYVVFSDSARNQIDKVMPEFMQGIQRMLPRGDVIDALPVFEDHQWMCDVLRTRTLLAINDDAAYRRLTQQAQV